MQSAEEIIKSMVHLAVRGSAAEWKSQYLARLWGEELARQPGDVPLFDFEYARREVLYRYVNKRLLGNAPIDYLEFGVFGGDSFRTWLRLNDRPESRFWGFDSFEGLPENWKPDAQKGAFDRQGRVPQVDDGRAAFVKGWFQDSLPGFLERFEPQNRLVLHMDADLFTSTLYVLMNMDRFIVPGTLLIFDEFKGTVRFEEFEALYHYANCCRRTWRMRAARRDHVKVVVEITE